MDLKDGGPAFPFKTAQRVDVVGSPGAADYEPVEFPGMSLRDHFAGLAMQAFLSIQGNEEPRHNVARDAYDYADAMIAARNR